MNSDSTKYQSSAGIRGLTLPAPGAGSSEPVDSSAVLATYSCGPMEFAVTQSIVDFSKANEALQAQGKMDQAKPHPQGGWKAISSLVYGGVKLGFPTDGSKPRYVYLAGTRSPAQGTTPADTVVYVSNAVDSQGCDLLDTRQAPRDGGILRYKGSSGTAIESRYVLESGKLVVVESAKSYGVNSTINRKASPLSTEIYKSTRYPYQLQKNGSGPANASIALPATTDGFNQITFSANADGSGSATYYLIKDGQTYTSPSTRRAGPTQVVWNTNREIVSLRGLTATGSTVVLAKRATPYTVAEYNAATGQNWNGYFESAADFDLSIPFSPTPYIAK